MTIKELVSELRGLQAKVAEAWRILDLDKKQIETMEIEAAMNHPDFWQDAELAKKQGQRLDELKKELTIWEKLKKDAADLLEMAELDMKDQSINLREDLEKQLLILQKEFSKAEFSLLFSGKHDAGNAIVSIHAGTGGVDAMDFAEMLLRMYLRFCEKKGFNTQMVNESRGGEAGIKSATIIVRGNHAYGHLKSEHGVHRLVRISPFDAEKMRHTSFALVEVLPEIDEKAEIEIKPDDLRIDTFLASGHGGQSVQTTYSAVRIVHLPTGLTVACQNERSQSQNKETAMKILKSKLAKMYEEQQSKEMDKIRGEYHEAGWSNQARSYVLHPYHLVKDHRTEFESKEPDKILDGELDNFVEAYLKWNRWR
ncbi:MAG: peptide chain release factor 2 [Candidatus Magasanikbacteria bacterium]|nr:peptide chain release factor 2 [Candidatus Magasanikbacteria bacterium]